MVLLYCDIYKPHSVADRHTSPSLFHLHSLMLTSSPQVAIRFVSFVTPASWTQMAFRQVKVKAITCTASFQFLLFWYKKNKAKEAMVQTQYWAALSWCQALYCCRTSFRVNIQFYFFLVSFRCDYDHELRLSLALQPIKHSANFTSFFFYRRWHYRSSFYISGKLHILYRQLQSCLQICHMVQTAADEPCELLWPPVCHFPLAFLWLWVCSLFYTAHRTQRFFSHLKGSVIFLWRIQIQINSFSSWHKGHAYF